MDVDWLIAERPGKVRTLKQHPRKNKTAINIEYMKASIRAKVEAPISHHQATVRLRGKPGYKGLLKNDNQLAMLFTLANLFRAGPNDTSVGEISLKTGDNTLNWRQKRSLNRLIQGIYGRKNRLKHEEMK
ncbi:putative transposase [Enterobacter asburiae]|uniref:Putative transposase n=1 Tax=Enterobacter asburiae TaxID=61645 RepID=A0A376FB56_ENTAS|nr:putative transposase [Enterobacter asburiae]